ncbi:MAG: acyltransferase [Sphingomonas bacterium]
MAKDPFITRQLSPWLDLIRAMAAFAVLAGHSVQQGLYSGPWPFTIALQQNAVIVFFVLSGLVIATSVDRKAMRLRDYALARLVRILPVALPALAISVAVAAIGQSQGVSGGEVAPAANALVGDGLLPAMFFLSESYRTGLWINPPYWSLCYEVWFYAIFAAATFLKDVKRLAWVVLLAVLAGPNILLLLPIWLLGVWLARSRKARILSVEQARIRIAMALVLLLAQRFLAEPLLSLLVTVARWNLAYSQYALSYFALGVGVALGITGLRKLVEEGQLDISRFARPISFAANMSFSLYLLHWPLIAALRIAHVSAGRDVFGFAGLLLLICAACALFATVGEHRRHQLRSMIERILPHHLRHAQQAGS